MNENFRNMIAVVGLGLMLGIFMPGNALAADEATVVPEMEYVGPDRPGFTGNMEVESVDDDGNILTLKVYINKKEGEYTLVACTVDDHSVIEKNGKAIDMSELTEGDLVHSDTPIYDDSARSCGKIIVVERKEGEME